MIRRVLLGLRGMVPHSARDLRFKRSACDYSATKKRAGRKIRIEVVLNFARTNCTDFARMTNLIFAAKQLTLKPA
jgi:hypothetical protein